MVSSGGGGGFNLPRMDDPVQIVIMLLVLGVLVWVGSRFFDT